MNAPQSVTANFTAVATVQVTVGTSPSGLSFSVDGTAYTTAQTLTWTVGSSHTIATTSPQTSGGVQSTFTSWSDGGAISHSVTAPATATTYTASFSTAYLLTTAASPSAGGTVSPTSGTYYASGTVVPLLATPNSGYTFSSWTGNVASASSASTSVTMNAPQSVTANFTAIAGPPDYTVSPATPSQTVAAGGAAKYTIDVQSTGGTYNGSVTLSVTGLPAGATASFSPNPVVLGGTVTKGSSALTVQTAGTQTAAARAQRWLLITPALGLVLLPFGRLRRQHWYKLLLTLALAGIVGCIVGCGGGYGMTQSKNYTLTITGTSGTDIHTTTVQLWVQ
jgi:hypothetical protein